MVDRAQLTAWMTAAAEGDRAAVEPLFQALWPLAVTYATRMLGGDGALAEDCAQDALVALFGQLDRFDRTRDALTWTLTHVTWQCRTARRRRTRRAEVPADAAPTGAHDGRAHAEERDLVRAALAALATLEPRDAEVLAAALADEATALRGALAPATFRKRLERAVGRLRSAWRARHGTI